MYTINAQWDYKSAEFYTAFSPGSYIPAGSTTDFEFFAVPATRNIITEESLQTYPRIVYMGHKIEAFSGKGSISINGVYNMDAVIKSGERVRSSSSRSRNQEIDQEIVKNIAHYSEQGPEAIEKRIKELDKKWDIERTLEVNAGILGLTGAILALTVDKRWAILPAVVTSFLVQHAVQGWCPPLPLFRLLGFKSRPELDREKYALKALRDDFKNINNATQAWKSVNE